MFCLLVVLIKLSVLVKCLSRKTPLRKPKHGKRIISIKPRLKNVCDILGLVYCFVELYDVFVLSLRDKFHTSMARYSLFVLKVSLSNN